jgi:signal transduction histidine kinase
MVVREGLETLVSVPLISSGKALGALTLASRQNAPIQGHELELLTIIGQQIGMAIENAHLYHSAERVAEELTILHQISTILASTLNADEIYEQIVVQSVKLLNCSTVCVLDWDDAGQKARLLAGHGITDAEGNFLQTQIDSFDCLRDLVICRDSVAVNDTQTDSRIPASWLQRLGLRALLCVPIRSLDESFGSLFLMDRQSERHWRYEEIVLIEAFVNRAAVALMNANLHKQLEWAAALEERQRIAADMHDGLGQTVSLLGLQIDNAMDLIKTGSKQQAVDELSMTRETVRQVSVEVRRSIASLQRTPQPLRSLQELLSSLPEKLAWADKTQIHFEYKLPEPLFLPQEQGDQVLFVVQEALLNAHRHAHAKNIMVALEPRGWEICITVEDDGVGFEQGAWWETSQSHFGLGVMHSRAARIGAELHIDSSPGRGTRVTLTLPGQEGARSAFADRTREYETQNSMKQGMTQ